MPPFHFSLFGNVRFTLVLNREEIRTRTSTRQRKNSIFPAISDCEDAEVPTTNTETEPVTTAPISTAADGEQQGNLEHEEDSQPSVVENNYNLHQKVLQNYIPSDGAIVRHSFVLTCVTVLASAALYVKAEGWSYFNSVYYSIVSFTTVGFGDLVSATLPVTVYIKRLGHHLGNMYFTLNLVILIIGISLMFQFISCCSHYWKMCVEWFVQKVGYEVKKWWYTRKMKNRITPIDVEEARTEPEYCEECKERMQKIRQDMLHKSLFDALFAE